MLAYDPCQADRFGEQFDRFFGTERWRTILEGRPTSSQAPELRTALLSLYRDQLLDHWAYAGTIMEVAGPRGKKYDMFAATDSEVGARIMRWAGKASQPPSLFD